MSSLCVVLVAAGCSGSPAYPLGRPADGRKVYIKPADHFASGDRQVLGDNIADRGANTCDLNAPIPGQFLLFDARITASSDDDRGQIDTGRWYLLSTLIDLTGMAFFMVASTNALLPKMRSSLESRIPKFMRPAAGDNVPPHGELICINSEKNVRAGGGPAESRIDIVVGNVSRVMVFSNLIKGA